MLGPVNAQQQTKSVAEAPPGPSGPSRVVAGTGRPEIGNQAALRRAEALLSADPGRRLDPAAQAVMAREFGRDFSRVRVHDDARAAESARDVGAAAYTVGEDVVFGEGMYAPGSADGLRLIAHELAHVAQPGGAGVLRRQALTLRNGHQVGAVPAQPGNNTKQDAVDALTRLYHLWAVDNQVYNDTINTLWASYGPGDVIPDANLKPLTDAITRAEKPDLATAVANTMLGLQLPPPNRGIGAGLENNPDDIKAVQGRLMAIAMMPRGTPTGLLDAPTEAALTAFKQRVAAGTLGIAADRPDELDSGLDKFGGQTLGVMGDDMTVTLPPTKENPKPEVRTVHKPLVVFVPRNAPPDKNKVSVFFTPADNPTSFVSQQGLRSQYDNAEWILIAVPGLMEAISPNWVALSTAEIQKCLTAAQRQTANIDALRLVAHSRGARGLEHTIGKGGPATVDVKLVERVTVFDASYKDLGNAVRADAGTMPAATDPGGVQLYDTTVTNVSGIAGTKINVSQARALFYVRFVQDGLALHKIDPADIGKLRADVRDATYRLLGAIPPRGTFATKQPTPTGQNDLQAFFTAHAADLALVDDKVNGLSPVVAPADMSKPSLDLGFRFDLSKKDPNRTLSAHHWLAAELAHEAVD